MTTLTNPLEAPKASCTIYSTTDYDMFKFAASNRKISELQVRRLQRSIRLSNRLHVKPILVNSDFEVIDGQHRLCAASRLNVPVYYQVDTFIGRQDIEVLNSAVKIWTNYDWIAHHADRGNINCQRMLDFCRENQVNTGVARMYAGFPRSIAMTRNVSDDLISGSIYFNPKDLDIQRLDLVRRFCETHECKKESRRLFNTQFTHTTIWNLSDHLLIGELIDDIMSVHGKWIGKPCCYEQLVRIAVRAINGSRRKNHALHIIDDIAGDGIKIMPILEYRRMLKGS